MKQAIQKAIESLSAQAATIGVPAQALLCAQAVNQLAQALAALEDRNL